MGHSSARAALIYQHASRERERAITAAISARVEAVRSGPNGHVAGTAGERRTEPAAGRERHGAADLGRGAESG